MRGKRKSQPLTGLDYLVVLADRAVERGDPYAAEFRHMVTTAIMANDDEPAPLLLEAIATRPLHDHEHPAAIVGGRFTWP